MPPNWNRQRCMVCGNLTNMTYQTVRKGKRLIMCIPCLSKDEDGQPKKPQKEEKKPEQGTLF